MKYLYPVGCLALLCMTQPASAQTTETEKAEKRLADLLTPGSKVTSSATTSPLQWKASGAVEDISVPVKPFVGVPVRLPEMPVRAVKPSAVPEAQPLVSYQDQPKVPKAVELPTKPLVKVPSVDVNQPLPIPILAQPQKDRASLADPTLDASLSAALKALAPARTKPLPFTPLNLPDPFEHLRSGQLRNPPEENPMPPVIPLQRPTK